MSAPLVSIVITAYNAEPFIGAVIAAALRQNYPNFEIVVVDDGSTDATGSICENISDNRLRYIPRKHLGRSCALNAAISLADGEYIAINDADDISYPDRLSYVVGFMQAQQDVVLVGTDYQTTSEFSPAACDAENRESSSDDYPIRWITSSRLYRSNPFVHSTVLFPKSVWKEAGGYDETLQMCVDYDFFFRTSKYGRVAWLPRKTLCYYTHPASYFKKKNPREYLATLSRIKQRARNALSLPLIARCYDAIPYYVALKSLLASWR
jgi:glycosyltransferase involved in cell wall biosynthesis